MLDNIDASLPEGSNEKEQPIRIWGNLTDPHRHNPEKFRYLVYGINLNSARLRSVLPEGQPNKDGDQSINLYKNPERLADKVSLSTSLIDEKHRRTWGDAGLMITAPDSNVIIASSGDVGAPNHSKERLLRLARTMKKKQAAEVLQESSDATLNEVVVLSKTEKGKINLVGFFAKVGDDGYSDPALAMQMKYHASRLGLPFVEIKEISLFGKDNKFDSTYLNAIYNGRLYALGRDDPEVLFRSTNGHTNRFISPEEFQELISFIKTKTKAEVLIGHLLNRYKEVDKLRQTPKLIYGGGNGRLISVRMRHEYGANEAEYRIGVDSLGNAYFVDINLREERAEERVAILGSASRPASKILLNPDQRATVVTEMMDKLEASIKKEEVRKFYEEIKAGIYGAVI